MGPPRSIHVYVVDDLYFLLWQGTTNNFPQSFWNLEFVCAVCFNNKAYQADCAQIMTICAQLGWVLLSALEQLHSSASASAFEFGLGGRVCTPAFEAARPSQALPLPCGRLLGAATAQCARRSEIT
eukprot:4930241-Pleurochrysis_carterae.AAC.10